MRKLPPDPTYSRWLSVLEGDVDEDTLRWLISYPQGLQALTDPPQRRLLWNDLANAPNLPWTEDLLAALGANGAGPPSGQHALPFLNHPASGLALRRALGFHVRDTASRYNDRGDVAVEALALAGDPVSLVALKLGGLCPRDRKRRRADAWQTYATAFNAICDPQLGGGQVLIELTLGLTRTGWGHSMEDLTSTVLHLGDHPGAVPSPTRSR